MFSIWINDNIGTNDLMSGLGVIDSQKDKGMRSGCCFYVMAKIF